MKQVILLFALIAAIAASAVLNLNEVGEIKERIAVSQQSNIIGGTNATIEAFNYLSTVHIELIAWLFIGTAIVINEHWLLTSVYNVKVGPPEAIRVRIGSSFASSGGSLLDVSEVVIYPHFTEGPSDSLALLKVSQPLKFSKEVQPAKFGTRLPRNGANTVVPGFGLTARLGDPFILRKVSVPFLNYNSCKQYYPGAINSTDFCTYKEGAGPCFLDLGSPVLYNGKVIGLFAGTQECGGHNSPSVYVDLTQLKYRKWIAETTRHHEE